MNVNNTTNTPIVYNPEIISKIKEMINEGFNKLKAFVKVKKQSKFEIYCELEEKFNSIALKLEKYDIFNDELDYFLLISDEILYIIHQNCEDNTFGHCEFALELFDFFMEIWNAKIELSENYSKIEIEKYSKLKISFKERYHQYRREFYWNVYEYSEDFDENESYEFAKTLRR